jgi:hypothetical protein
MVTANPADAIGLGSRIGRIRAGQQADLVAIATRGDPYRDLIRATERDVQLVMVDGHVRYGSATLLADAAALNASALSVAGTQRAVSLPDPSVDGSVLAWDDVVSTLERVRSAQHATRGLPFVAHAELPALDALAPDAEYLAALEAAPIPGGSLAGLRAYYS